MIKELLFKLITSKKLTPVYHRGCGWHVGYVADISKLKRDSNNFYFLDGSHPGTHDKKCIPCAKCKKNITTTGDIILT